MKFKRSAVLFVAILVCGLGMLVPARAGAATTRHSKPSVDWAIANRPKGWDFRSNVSAATKERVMAPLQAAERAARQSHNAGNPSCSGCTPPLNFNGSGLYVMGGQSGSPGKTTVTPVFWAPSGYSFPSGYESIIDQYFNDVAAASATNGNVFSVAEQYYQIISGVQSYLHYHVTANPQLSDAGAYPTSGCPVSSGFTECITDAQEQAELQRLATANSLTTNDSNIYMVFFPPNVETCQDAGGTTCSTNVYCGYHSAFSSTSGTLIYANMPYPPLNGCGDFWEADAGNPYPAPNGNANADAMISVISHEYNEAITDYDGAWYDSAGNEDGDECAYVYGDPIGGSLTSGTAYNQLINGHGYWTQDEWSNADYASGVGTVADQNQAAGGFAAGTTVAGCIQRPSTPTVTSISPTSTTTAGGTNITVTGTSFVPGAEVYIGQGSGLNGAIMATNVSVVSGTQLTATTPAGKKGVWEVFVQDQGGHSASSGGSVITYDNASPTVSSLSPTDGPASGGTKVTITGTGFVSGAQVLVGQGTGLSGALSATNVTVVSSTEITADTPSGAKGGRWNMFVEEPGGAAAKVFTYLASISSVTPSSGLTTGSTPIVIDGNGFLTGAQVLIGQGTGLSGAVAATNVTVVSPTEITCTTPAGKAGTWNVFIYQTPGGASQANKSDLFTYN